MESYGYSTDAAGACRYTFSFSKKNYLFGFALTAIGLALQIRANHFQITYYLLFILLIYGLFQLYFAIREKTLKDFAKPVIIVIAAGNIGAGGKYWKIWTTLEYSKYSTRGPTELELKKGDVKTGLERDYVFHWSNGKLESFTFLIPNLFGGASVESVDRDSELAKQLRRNNIPPAQISGFLKQTPTYWGDQPSVAGPIYAGVIVCFLFVLAFFYADKKMIYWLVTCTIVGFVLSWGKNFETINYLMYEYFPVYNKFRAVSMCLTIPLFSMPLLGFIGLEKNG